MKVNNNAPKGLQLMAHTPRLAAYAFVLSSGLLLSACGGSSGGGSSQPSTSNPPTSQNVTVTGTAAKGILKGAKVELCTNVACSGEDNPLAVATTEEDGSYRFDIEVERPQVLIARVSHKPGAKMVCDAPSVCGEDFGEYVDMPENLELRSMATVDPSSTTISSSITPLTELSTVAAQESMGGLGQITPEAMNNGYSAVRNMFGLGDGKNLNLLTPIDVTKGPSGAVSEDGAVISLLSAAFADGDIKEKINTFSTAIRSGSIDQDKVDEVFESAKSVAEETESFKEHVGALNDKQKKAGEIIVDPSNPSDEINEVSHNVKAVKQLVEDVRTLGWEIYPDLEKALKNESPDPSSLMGKIDSASEIFSEEFGVLNEGLTEVSTLFTLAITNANDLDDAFEIDNDTTLRSLAHDYFYADNAWKLEFYEQNAYLCENLESEQDNYWYQWEREYCDEMFWDQSKLDEKATAYASQFSETPIVRSNGGKTWTITHATFESLGAEEKVAISSISATVPNVTGKDKIKDISASLTGKATYRDIVAEVKEAKLNITQTADLDLRKDNNTICVDKADFTADTVITYEGNEGNRTFTGLLTATAGTNATIRSKNGIEPLCNGVVALLPEKVSLEGKFKDDASLFLDAALTAELHNFDTYWYNAKGADSDVPVKFELVDNDKLKVSVGAEDAANYLRYTLEMRTEETPQVASLITIKDCNFKGNARCPEVWDGVSVYDPETGQYTFFDSIIDMLLAIKNEHEQEYAGIWIWTGEYWQLFGQVEFTDTKDGYITLNDENADIVDLETLKANKVINTFAPRQVSRVIDEEDNFINATITAQLKAKIANDLPETDIKLVVKRNEFDKARADLTLGWKKTTEARRSLTLSALAEGRTEEQLAQSLKFLVSDEGGTAFTLQLADKDSPVVGTIVKDGTTYATVTEEGSVYIVTYHYNDKGGKEDSRSQEFESLF